MLRFFSYSFTASDGSDESIAGRVVSPSAIMVHHGISHGFGHPNTNAKYIYRKVWIIKAITKNCANVIRCN